MTLIRILLMTLLQGEAIKASKLISSSCVKDTKWNSKNVGQNLRNWIESIRVRDDYKIGQTYTTFGFWDEARTRLKFAGVMNEQNRAVGRFWSSLGLHEDSNFINGFLYGNPDAEDSITDETAIFLYPDMKTALVGSFKGSVMMAAQSTKVVKERCERGVKRIKVKRPNNQTTFVKFSRPDAHHFLDPTIPDPYERKTAFISHSPGKGDGVFAKRSIRKGELIAYYAGFIYNKTIAPMYHTNMTDLEVYAMHTNAISLDGDVSMNIPPAFHSVVQFRATLAHKTNHQFLSPSAYFTKAFHPRFGHIRALVAERFIPRGQEVSVNYGYHWNPANWPQWYLKLYEEELGLVDDQEHVFE